MDSDRILLSLFTVVLFLFVDTSHSECSYPGHETHDKTEHPGFQKAKDRLKPFLGQRFQIKDASQDYTYDIGVCTNAAQPLPALFEGQPVGVIQQSKSKTFAIGLYNQTELMTGKDWLLLEYYGGGTYNNHCNGEPKRAMIMFICNPDVTEIMGRVVEENNQKIGHCYYLFEVEHKSMCPADQVSILGLSPGSIFLIIFFTLLGLYLILGCLYKRFALGAKGYEQIPNYSFWQDFRNLQADGCDFICRSRSTHNPRAYKGIGDDQLQSEDDERDDHLLPM